MLCINCQSPKTNVLNSRPHKTQPRVWRRRSCPKCQTIVTTYEFVATADQVSVAGNPFSVAQLCISLNRYLADNYSPDDAFELAQTVGEALARRPTVSRKDVAVTAYDILLRFNKKAALRYGLDHECVDPATLL